MNNKAKLSRRSLLKLSTAAAVAIPTSHILLTDQALAHHLKIVDTQSQRAKRLGYTHDSSTVDAEAYPKHKAGQTCRKCKFLRGKKGDQWRACPIFGGQGVNVDGWCKSWASRA